MSFSLKIFTLSLAISACLALEPYRKRGVTNGNHGSYLNSVGPKQGPQVQYQIQYSKPTKHPLNQQKHGKQVKVIVNPPIYYNGKVPEGPQKVPSMNYGGWYPMKDPSTEGWIGLESSGSRYEGYGGLNPNYPHSFGAPDQSSTNADSSQLHGFGYGNADLADNGQVQSHSQAPTDNYQYGQEVPQHNFALQESAGNGQGYEENPAEQNSANYEQLQSSLGHAGSESAAQSLDDLKPPSPSGGENPGNAYENYSGSNLENSGGYGASYGGQATNSHVEDDIRVAKLLASSLTNQDGKNAWDGASGTNGGYEANSGQSYGSTQNFDASAYGKALENSGSAAQNTEKPSYVVKSLESILWESGAGLNQNLGGSAFGKGFDSSSLQQGLSGGHNFNQEQSFGSVPHGKGPERPSPYSGTYASFSDQKGEYPSVPNLGPHGPRPNGPSPSGPPAHFSTFGKGPQSSPLGPGGYGFVRGLKDSTKPSGGPSSYSSINLGAFFSKNNPNFGRSKLAPSSPYQYSSHPKVNGGHPSGTRYGGPPNHQSSKLSPIHIGKNLEYSGSGSPNGPNIEFGPPKSHFGPIIVPNYNFEGQGHGPRHTKVEVGPWGKH